MKQLRTGKIWLHFAGIFGCFLIGAIFGTIPRIIYGFENEPGWMVLLSEIFRIISTVGALIIYVMQFLGKDLNNRMMSLVNFKPILWGIIGLLLPMVLVCLFALIGETTSGEMNQSLIIQGLLKAFGMALAAGVIEEVVFRGYLVAILKLRYGTLLSAIIPSLLFTLLHISGVKTISGALQLLIAGLAVSVLFLVIRYYTGSVWNSSIVHFLWNFIILNDLLLIGSGQNKTGLILIDYPKSYFYGGEFGVEASVPAIIIYVLTALSVWKYYRNKQFKSWGLPE